MLRRRLWSAIAATAAAATAAAAGSDKGVVITPGETIFGIPQKNGECPQCKTQAPTFKREPCFAADAQGNPVRVLCGPRLIRCSRCSNAFWQDEEI